MKPIVLVASNALDDATRTRRGIESDSPAASRKVFLLCQALRKAGVRPYVLSLGRGKANGTRVYFPAAVRRVGGIPVVYAPFSHTRIVSELLSLFGHLRVLLRLTRHRPRAIVYYNRTPALIVLLLAAVVAGYRNTLDLEDGEVHGGRRWSPGAVVHGLIRALFDRACRNGALLACSALAASTRIRPVLCYYGTTTPRARGARFDRPEVTALMAGTIDTDTGADLLCEAIRGLRDAAPPWARHLSVVVTGKGPGLERLEALAASGAAPRVEVRGRLSDADYRAVLHDADVGLALKLNDGPYAHTTFPSKVVEFASEGLLVITTAISDVEQVLGDGARYLRVDDPRQLQELLREVVEDRAAAGRSAERGLRAVEALCAPASAGRRVAEFLFGRAP